MFRTINDIRKIINEMLLLESNASDYQEGGEKEALEALTAKILELGYQFKKFALNDNKISNVIEDDENVFEYLWVLDTARHHLTLEQFIHIVFEHVNMHYSGQAIVLIDPNLSTDYSNIVQPADEVPIDAQVEFRRRLPQQIFDKVVEDLIHVLDVEKVGADIYTSQIKPTVYKGFIGLVKTIFHEALTHEFINTTHDQNIINALIEDDENNWVMDLAGNLSRQTVAEMLSNIFRELLADTMYHNENIEHIREKIEGLFGKKQIEKLRDEMPRPIFDEDEWEPIDDDHNPLRFRMPERIKVDKFPDDELLDYIINKITDDILFPMSTNAYTVRSV